MTLVIFAHPDNKGSHNAAVLKYVTDKLRAKGTKFEIIDLYADNFDPVFHPSEYEHPKADVKKYQKMILDAKRIVIIYPIWWYNMPAIMKGFIDRVLTPGFAYNFKTDPVKGFYIEQHLKGKKAIVVNTYGGGEQGMNAFGNAPVLVMDKAALGFCGIEITSRIDWFEVRGPAVLPDDVKTKLDQVL